MKIRTRTATLRVSALSACCALASAGMPGTAFAQAAATPPAPPTPPAAPPTMPAPAATPPAAEAPAPAPAPPTTEAAPAPAPAAPAPPPEAAPPPAPIAEAPPEPPKEEKLPSIDVGGWLRVGMQFQGSSDPKKLNDQSFDTVFGELHTSGKVHKLVGWTLNLAANALANNPTGYVQVEDAIIQLDLLDEFHIWAGQTLVPVDRTNFSGPFFISPWTYPGIFTVGGTTKFATPMEGPFGRNIGADIWGDIGGKGMFKYFVSMMNMNNPSESPLFSGRLAFSPIGGEPGLWGSSTFYGEKDVFSIGVGAQYKHNGSVGQAPVDAMGNTTGPAPTSNYTDINADVLAEFKLGDAGTITGEGAYYHFGGDYEATKNMFFLLGSYLTPKVGPGGFQPMVRYQRAWEGDTKWSQIEGHVAYVVKGAQMRGLVGFRHTDIQDAGAPDVVGNAVEIALQTIMF